MALEQFRTADELKRAQWAEKFTSVAKGKLYTTEDDPLSPFPIHKYFANKLLGNKIKMLQVNAGAALVEHFVADTLTEFTITVDGDQKPEAIKPITDWYAEVDFDSKEEEACRALFGCGYGVQQIFRTVEGEENRYPVTTVSNSTWYPDIPAFEWQTVTSGRRITVFAEKENGQKQWYAFIEKHEQGKVSYHLLAIEREDALEGTPVSLGTIRRFAGLEDTKTDLDFMPIFQVNRQKGSDETFGTSLLYAIWDILQEITETQTQIRQERIKHLRAKFAAPIESLARVEKPTTGGEPINSKQRAIQERTQSALYDLMQEIFPVPAGAQMPAYIQRDLESIRIGLELIESLKSDAAAIVGCPKSVFNIDEAAGNVKVDTEKRKDRRYVRKIIQAQWQMARLREQVTKAWWKWSTGADLNIKIEFASPFNLTQQETVELMKEMNPMATLISEQDAVNEVHKNKSPEERQKILANIKAEKQQAKLAEPTQITL